MAISATTRVITAEEVFELQVRLAEYARMQRGQRDLEGAGKSAAYETGPEY